MSLFMDVHHGLEGITHEQLAAEHEKDKQLEAQEGARFLKAWADPSSGKVFCLSEAPSMEAVRRTHERAGHPADEIYEVPVQVE